MANRPKQKGTARETAFKTQAQDDHRLPAWRDENNSACSDLWIEADIPIRHEVKDRQNLNAHKIMKEMQSRYPGERVALLWHRTSRKNGNTRLSPDGPDLAHQPVDQYFRTLEVLRRLRQAYEQAVRRGTEDDYAAQMLAWVLEPLEPSSGDED